MFADDQPSEVFCSYHRGVNLYKHGKECSKVFHKLLDAPLVSDNARIKDSTTFSGLSEAGKAASFMKGLQF